MNTTSFTIRAGRRYRAGLEYEEETVDGEIILRYIPDGVFHVDGIRYDMRDGRGVNCVNTIVDRRPQWAGSYTHPQRPSQPPTEAELDHYVRTGRLPR